MSAAATTRNCAGCHNDFYNGRPEGDCWSLPTAQLVPRLLIPVDLPPPYDRLKTQTVPDCYKRQRYVTVDPKRSLTPDRKRWKS